MIHLAGPLFDWVQRCTRCGVVLADYRNTMVPEGSPPLAGWAQGTHVDVTEGNPRSLFVTDDPPDCEPVQ